jgi:glycosyltransferase 2 family protein
MKKRWPSLILGLVVSVIALAYLLRRDLGGVRDELLHARYWFVIPCYLLSVIGLWLRAVRWRVLLDGRISLKDSFHVMNVGYFINAVLPLRIGELVRAVLATRLDPPVRVLTSLSTILVERLIDTLAVFGLVGITLAILPVGLEIGVIGAVLGIGAVTGVIVLTIFAARPLWAHSLLDTFGRVIPLLRRPSLHEWADHLLDGIKPLTSWRATLLVLFWTIIGWASSVIAGYILLFAIFDDPTWAAAMAMIALASFVVAVPAVPGNLGPFEAAVVFGLAGAGLVENASDAPAVAFALLLHIINILVYVSLGLIGLWVQDVSLGEVTQAAQKLRSRQEPSS